MAFGTKVKAGTDVYKEVTLVLDTVQYASADVLFVTQEIAGFYPDAHEVQLDTLTVLDKDDQGGAFDLVFFRSEASMGGTINVALDISDASADEIATIVSIEASDYVDLVNSQYAVIPLSRAGMWTKLKPSSGDETSLFIGGISRNDSTHTASGITLKIGGIAL